MYKQFKLRDGLTLITAPVKGTKTVTVLVIVGTGSKYEDRKNNGISHFLEHMFFKGTKKRPTTLAISGELDAVGAEFNAFTSKEYTGYYVKADAAKTELALDVVSDILTNSKFDSEEIEREKGVIVEEINMYQDNPMMFIEDVFESLLYGDTPAGRDTAGTKENVKQFRRDTFLSYFNAQYQAKNTIVCLAGNMNDAVTKKVEKYFSKFSDSHRAADFQEKRAVRVAQTAPAVKLHFKKTDQAHLSLGVHTYRYGDKREAAARLLAIILGGSMSSRLFTEVRERRGLAYYVRTQNEPYTDVGYLTTQAGVQLDKIEEAIEVILSEYAKLKKELVSGAELKRVKDLVKGRVTIQLEASDDVAEWYGRQAVLKLTQQREKIDGDQIITPEEYFRKISRVTAAEIRAVAREIFVPEKLNLAVIGPFKDNQKFMKLLKF